MGTLVQFKNNLLKYEAKERPIFVITSVFNNVKLKDLKIASAKMLLAARLNQSRIYKSAGYKNNLPHFHEWLIILFHTTYAIYSEKDWEPGTDDLSLQELKNSLQVYVEEEVIPEQLLADKTQIIRFLCNTYPLNYLRTELWHCMEAALTNQAFYRKKDEQADLLYYYQLLAALIEAAHYLNNPTL
jgi:hypothetical protein